MTGENKPQSPRSQPIAALLIAVIINTTFITVLHYKGGRASPSISDLGWFDPFSSWAQGCGIPFSALSLPGLYALLLWGSTLRYMESNALLLSVAQLVYVGATKLAGDAGVLGSIFGYIHWSNTPSVIIFGITLQTLCIVGIQFLGIVSSFKRRSKVEAALYILGFLIFLGLILESSRPV